MGIRAQEAVTFNSKQTDIHLLRLLGILASGADDSTGIIDPAPGRETLAALADCTERTMANRIGKLIDSGELERVRMGSGPGNPSAYRILLDIPETTLLKSPANDYEQKGEKGEKLAQKVDRLEQEIAELKALFFTLLEQKGEREAAKGEKSEGRKGEKGERVKAKGGKGERERVKALSFKSADDPLDPFFDPEEEEKERGIPPPPFANQNGANGTHEITPLTLEWFEAEGIPPPEGDEQWAQVRHPAMRTWLTVTNRWPGYKAVPYIIEKLGIRPSAYTLRRVWTVWQVNEYNPTNITGILDRYGQEASERPVNGDSDGRAAIPAHLAGIIKR